jgi:plastocyanin
MKAFGLLAGLVLVIIGFVFIAAVTGWSSGYSTAGGPASIVLEDYRFTPNRIDARVGVPVRVTLTNRGTERHDLNFESLHMPGLGGVDSILAPGETRTISLTFDGPGTHNFICTLTGHAAAGMTGAAFVTP